MTSTVSSSSPAPFRIARVTITPRDRAQLALDTKAAAARIQAAFGGTCVGVSGVSTTSDATWGASVVLDARGHKDAKLLYDNANDERLWKTFVAALYTDGLCEVHDIESATTAPSMTPAKPR